MCISINGDVIDQHLTVLQLSNSETMDTKDVYVMANTSKKKTKSSLIVPKWTTTTSTNTEEIEIESADEYDSEAHTQTDEDIIIKRVLAKFNQQNKQIIRKKLSFVDSFQFWQNNIDQQNKIKSNEHNSIYYNKIKKKKNHINIYYKI